MNIYNSILIIVKRLISYEIFLFYKKIRIPSNSPTYFLKIIIANHGLPDKIILNRNKLVISKF